MTKNNLLKLCQLLLATNLVFWFLVACYFSFFKFPANGNHLVIKLLLFLEPVLYLVSLVGIAKKIKLVYLFSLLLTFGNAILSITDQMGIYDWISFGLSVAAFASLLLIRKFVF